MESQFWLLLCRLLQSGCKSSALHFCSELFARPRLLSPPDKSKDFLLQQTGERKPSIWIKHLPFYFISYFMRFLPSSADITLVRPCPAGKCSTPHIPKANTQTHTHTHNTHLYTHTHTTHKARDQIESTFIWIVATLHYPTQIGGLGQTGCNNISAHPKKKIDRYYKSVHLKANKERFRPKSLTNS